MENNKVRKGFEKPLVDEDFLMNIMSGDESGLKDSEANPTVAKTREKTKSTSKKKRDFEELFLTTRYSSGRSGKVVYIRSEFHERLLRIVQLAREEKTTLYSYIDNILDHHFKEFGADITDFFNERNKPIL